jgi:hypothetical protein
VVAGTLLTHEGKIVHGPTAELLQVAVSRRRKPPLHPDGGEDRLQPRYGGLAPACAPARRRRARSQTWSPSSL